LQFLQELWFVIKHVPELAQRYKKSSIVAALFLILSVASDLVKNRLFSSASIQATVLYWISVASLAFTGFVFLLAFVDLIKNRLHFVDLVCTNVAVDAYYHAPGEQAYELVTRLQGSNRTSASVRNFANLGDGYYEKISQWSVQHKLVSTPAVELLLHPLSSGDARANNFLSSQKTIFMYQNSAEFKPPLSKGSTFDLVYRISASGAPIEAAAFTTDGTLFALGVEYDTLRYHIAIHAPQDYKISLWESGVLDPNGAIIADETKRQKKPEVSISGSLLQWHISLAKKHLRYMLKFRFEAHGWQ
jgi:hypothetical protein